MKDLITTMLNTDIAKEIEREYRIILSGGLSDGNAEEQIISYYCSNNADSEIGIFWVLFALIQHKFGRMSPKIHAKAIGCIRSQNTVFSKEIADALIAFLDCPMPARKAVSCPRTIKCPWEAGTLLAYRIASCAGQEKSRFWNKYVLLRVVKIHKWPLSAIKPDLLYDESMYVALYNWVGEEVPDARIVEQLEYTPISIRTPMFPPTVSKDLLKQYLELVPESKRNIKLDAEYEESLYALDWGNKQTASSIFTVVEGGNNITTPACPENKKEHIPPLIGVTGFDIVLIKRLEKLFPLDGV